MRYPCLVPEKLCKTDIIVYIEAEELTEDGGPVVLAEMALRCNYQDSAKTIWSSEEKKIQLTGIALFCGDIAPDLTVISGGKVVIFGEERRIHQGRKARNPDGTVNYTELMLV